MQYTSDGAAEPDNEQLPAYLYNDLQESVAEMLKLQILKTEVKECTEERAQRMKPEGEVT